MKLKVKEWLEKVNTYLSIKNIKSEYFANLPSGMSLGEASVYKFGPLIICNSVVGTSGNFGSEKTVPIPVKYAPKDYINSATMFATTQWSAQSVGYFYISPNGTMLLNAYDTSKRWCKLSFVYIVGGVLRNPVISRLTAIFTSLLFGGDVDEAEAERAADKDSHHDRNFGRKKLRYCCDRTMGIICAGNDEHPVFAISESVGDDTDIRYSPGRKIQRHDIYRRGRSNKRLSPQLARRQFLGVGVQHRLECLINTNKIGVMLLTISERRWAA